MSGIKIIPRLKGTVKSINAQNYTANVLIDVEGIILQNVKVCSILTNPNNQINLLEFMLDMQVWVEFDQHTQPYVTLGLFSEENPANQDYNVLLQNFTALINELSLKGQIELNGGNYGGLVIVQNLVDKINRLENNFNILLNNISSGVLAGTSATGGATSTATAPLATGVSPANPITVVADLENTTITHGNQTN